MRRVLLIKIVTYFFEHTLAVQYPCDKETDILLDDGNMGLSSDFNWLGLLKVYLNDIDEVHVAVTGIVLVKPRYAVVSADDVIRIPKQIFLNDTHALFIADGDVQVTYSPVTYIVHPEYGAQTYHSIAIIELDIGDNSPLIPICFSTVTFDSRHLYLTGYTDENTFLEKMFYRILHTDKQNCEEFYKKEGLIDKDRHRQPATYLCGKWQTSSKSCVWDNGMALVSNSSGWFRLIGISIHGPGCAAPARFINILHYNSWIREVTRDVLLDKSDEDYDYIASDYALDLEYVPIHRTFTETQANRLYWPRRYYGPTELDKYYRINQTDQTYGPNQTHGLNQTFGGEGYDGPNKIIRSDRFYTPIRYYRPNWWRRPVGPPVKHDFVKWPFPVNTLQYFRVFPKYGDASIINIVQFDEVYALQDNLAYCKETDDERNLRYQEEFKLEMTKKLGGTVTYTILTYDLNFYGLTCVTLSVKCKNRTQAQLWFREESISYDDEDVAEPTLDKIVVTQTSMTTSGDETVGNRARSNSTVDDNTDKNKKITSENLKKRITYELAIKFDFVTKAVLNFKMYSSNKFPAKSRITPKIHPMRRTFNNIKFPKRRKMNWKFAKDVIDKTIRQAAFVVDHNAVLETASKGNCGEATPELIVMGCLFTSVWARR